MVQIRKSRRDAAPPGLKQTKGLENFIFMSARHNRYDKSELNKSEITSQGFLRAPAFATRTGVFTYRMADGTIVKELRPPSEVFKADSMRTLANVPVTRLHPKPGLLDSGNAKSFTVGFTCDDVRNIDEKYLQVQIVVIDADTIDEAKQGMQELSCGYICEFDPTPGIYNGEHYDTIQKNIVYNHLAIVPRGRAGSEVRMHLDAEDAEMVSEVENKKEIPAMEKIKIKDTEFDASPEMATAFAAHQKDTAEQMDAMQKQLDAYKAKDPESKDEPEQDEPTKEEPGEDKKDADKKPPVEGQGDKKMDVLSKENETLKAKCDALTSDLKKVKESRTDTMGDKKIQSLVKARLSVLSIAERVLPASVKLDEMSDIEIKKAVIKADSPESTVDGKSDEYVSARFDHIEERFGKVSKDRKDMGATIVKARQDAGTPDVDAARKRMMEESKDAYKKPVGFSLQK